MNVPDRLLHIESDSKVELICNRYDGDLLTFQIIFFVLPCLGCSCFFMDPESFSWVGFFFYLISVALIAFWVVYNFKNKIVFTMQNGVLEIHQGYPLKRLYELKLSWIKSVYVNRKYGSAVKTISWNDGIVIVEELVIVFKNGLEINLGSYFQDKHKYYLKYVIESKLAEAS